MFFNIDLISVGNYYVGVFNLDSVTCTEPAFLYVLLRKRVSDKKTLLSLHNLKVTGLDTS